MTFIIAKLIGLFASWGLPEPLRKLAAWAAIAVAAASLIVGSIAIYNASVIRKHEDKKAAAAIGAYDDSATARANDTVANQRTEDARRAAIEEAGRKEKAKPPEQRATMTPQSRAFVCAAMREDYTAKELAKMKIYQENCT